MARIFFLLMTIMSAISLSACDRSASLRAPAPDEVSAVIEPFFKAVRRGDQKAAEKYVAPGFLDDSKVQFSEMSALLKKSPRLAPVLQQSSGTGFYLTFAGQDGKYWVTSEVRMRRYGNRQMIEYWDVNAAEKPPEVVAHAATMKNFVNYGLIAVGFCALLGLGTLIWIVRNRTHLVAPDSAMETRRVAATVRDSDD